MEVGDLFSGPKGLFGVEDSCDGLLGYVESWRIFSPKSTETI